MAKGFLSGGNIEINAVMETTAPEPARLTNIWPL